MIEIPELGIVSPDSDIPEWLRSNPINVKVLNNKLCEFVIEGYEEDDSKEEYHHAIHNFLSLDFEELQKAQDHIFKYYKDSMSELAPGDDWYVEIHEPDKIWEHIDLCDTPVVTRRPYGDKEVYISLENRCDWEEEYGLQIVFKNGLYVNKVGSFDGHMTNSDAYANEKYENIIYVE